MQISRLLQKWSNLHETSKIVIVTDGIQEELAFAIRDEKIFDVKIEFFSQGNEFQERLEALRTLRESDLLMVMLSYTSFMDDGAREYFSPFAKPEGIRAKYIFVRLEITRESFIQGLCTGKEAVYGKITEMGRFSLGDTVRVKNAAGTDITLQVKPFVTCSHEIKEDGGMAFLPPSETSADVIPDTAQGTVRIDVTAGQLYHFGELKGYFGLVDAPVTLVVEKGMIVDVQGGGMAQEIKEKLFALPPDCRKLVELGQGLSEMEPTGVIGVDESILASCHFGFGDGGMCGTHWDVVISKPVIS